MEYPVYVPGMPDGVLLVTKDGLYTVFEARLPFSPQLLRLWLHGGGESACLGVLEPRGQELYLRRRLSRRQLDKLPANIEYATNSAPEEKPEEEPAEKVPEEESPAVEAPPTELAEAGERELAEPEIPDEGELEGLLWFSRPDGSLSAFDGKSSLVALPSRLRSPAPAARILRWQGREYMVFRY